MLRVFYQKKKKRVLYSGVLVTHGNLFREKPWGFRPKVNINFLTFCTWAWGAQLSWLQTFNLSLFSGPPLTFLHLLFPSARLQGKYPEKVVQLLLLFSVFQNSLKYFCYSFLHSFIAITEESWKQEDQDICVYSVYCLESESLPAF